MLITLIIPILGRDKISNQLLKELKHHLAPPLSFMFNSCFKKGFPTCLIKSIIIPIHKGGSRDTISNYRLLYYLRFLKYSKKLLISGLQII